MRRKRLTAKRHSDKQIICKSTSLCNTSIAELYELTNGLDMSPFSISEGAIYDMSHNRQKLQTATTYRRRTVSDNVSLGIRKPESPKRRRRKNRKSSALEVMNDGRHSPLPTAQNSTKRLLTSTPLTPRRKNQSDKNGTANKALFPATEAPRTIQGTCYIM